jgi:hypothetical protein
MSNSCNTLGILLSSDVLTEDESKHSEQNLQQNFSKRSQNEMKLCTTDIKVEPTPAD